MDIKNIYNIAQRAMGAQLVRLNATASNLANADNIASNPQDAYKPIKPVIEPIKEFKPGHPMADQNGFIYRAPVNIEEEYVDMLEASRQYQNNVEVISTVRALMLKTASMGK